MPPSLYANLLNKKAAPGAQGAHAASSPAVISSEPVKYSFKKASDEAQEEKKAAADAALRFQPVKRPQVQQQKAKPRALPPSGSVDKQTQPPAERKPRQAVPAAAGGDSIENWIDEDADDYYVAEYTRHKQEEKERQRENKKRRKKKNTQHETREVDFNVTYDPEQPIRLEDYRGSLEELDARYEWKQRLYAHRRKKAKEEPRAPVTLARERAAGQEEEQERERELKPRAFAPPANYNFAPPPAESAQSFNRVPPPSSLDTTAAAAAADEDDDYEPPPAVSALPTANVPAAREEPFHGFHVHPPPPPPPPHGYSSHSPAPPYVPQSASAPQVPGLGYPRPPSMQGMWGMPLPPPPGPWQQQHLGLAMPPALPGMAFPPLPPGMPFPPPPQFLAAQASTQHSPIQTPPPPPPQTFAPTSASSAPTPPPAQPSSSAAVISRAPVRFSQPAVPSPTEEEPPAVGGLGFNSSSAPISEPPSDNEADSDAPRSKAPGQKGFAKRLLQKYGWKEGQGLGADSSGITTILQHQTQKRKKKSDAEGGGFGSAPAIGRIVGGKKRKVDGGGADAWSIVARFDGMLAGMDIDHEIGEGDLMQRMGEAMDKFGHVERLYIHRGAQDATVFVKFTSALSAYRAVQASHEQDFLGNGRKVSSGFWDEEKFSKDVFE